VKRVLLALCAASFGIFVMTLGIAFAQGPEGGGFPPESALYDDVVLLARLLPLLVALGIAFGVWRAKVSQREPDSAPDRPTVTRHNWGTVTAHWTNAIGFMLGMITGLIVLRRLPRPDDLHIVFIIHYIGAGLAVFGVSSHLAQNAVTGGMGLLPRGLKDVREGLGELVEYTGIFGPSGAVFGLKLPKVIRETFSDTFRAFGIAPPKRLGKYLPAEKTFSYLPWAIIVGVIIVTGFIKAFRYLYPIAPPFIAQVTFIHDAFAYLAVAMLAIHLAAVLLVPRNWPLLISMFTTQVSRKHVQQWHPIWYNALVAREEQPAPAPAPSAPVTSMPEKTTRLRETP
jgi:cytochrome b subunit of formate dehydrogenase